MPYRWVKNGVFLDLRDEAGVTRGEVVRSFLSKRLWLGWTNPRRVDSFTTRAAAMRAVASRTDPKKGFFAA